MRRVAVSLCSLLLLACDGGQSSATASPADCPTASAQPAAAASSGAGLTPAVQAAASSASVSKVKLRFDASGDLVKQAVYHGDRSAIPEPVLALVEGQFPGASANSYETEHYAELGEVHEVELTTADGQACEVAGRSDGSLVYTECRIDPAALPEPVAAQVAAAAPGGKVLEAERKADASSEHYTVEVEHEGREYYLHIGADGALISKHVRVTAIVELPVAD